jgi:hypothetical protein
LSLSRILGCFAVSSFFSCANDKAGEESFQQAMRTVNAARPQRTFASKDPSIWSESYAGKVIKVRGRIEYLSLKMGALRLDGAVDCFLARDQEKLWPLAVGSVVTVKGLRMGAERAVPQGFGTPIFACVILGIEP